MMTGDDRIDVQKDHRHGKGRLGELAIVHVALCIGHATALGQVPWRRAWMLRVGAIRSSLAVDADGPHANKDDVDHQAKQRVEEAHHVQDGLDQEGEHG